jgi:hypothetical protein
MLLALLLCGAPADAETGDKAQAVDTVVVCPQEFRETLEPWTEFRRAQGHQLAFVSNLLSPEQLRAEVRRQAASGTLKYLVLVGDADPRLYSEPAVRRRSIPAHYATAEVNVKFGSSPEIATDNWYADLNDDRIPDLAVGRLTCDSSAELAALVEKILAYERSADFGPWRRQVHFVAGLGGFGAVADTVLEAAAKSLISEGVPSAFCTTMTYGSWQSPYCPDPRAFRDVTLSRLNEGSLFWVYLGHGQQRSVDEVRVPGGRFPILSTDDTIELACEHGAPIACFLACYSGAFDLPRDCLAEEMLAAEGGPVAILCGSRVTMPYAMTVLGSELLAQVFTHHAPTLGQALLAAKQRTMQTENPSKHRQAMDAMARLMSPTADLLTAERAEHLDLFNLLGDPLLRIPYPNTVDLDVAGQAAPGTKLAIRGRAPLAGRGVVELSVRRDRLAFRPPRRGQFDPRGLAEYAETYVRANEPRLSHAALEFTAGEFKTELEVPADAQGPCHVRVFIEGAEACAAGAADLLVAPVSTAAVKPQSAAAKR